MVLENSFARAKARGGTIVLPEGGKLFGCGQFAVDQQVTDLDEVGLLSELEEFTTLLTRHSMIHEDMKKFFEGYPPNAHPMAILASMAPPVPASISAPAPISITPILTDMPAIPMREKRTETPFPYRRS